MQEPATQSYLRVFSLLALIAFLPGSAFAEDVPIVDGALWSQSSKVEKKAYLVGASNLLSVEYAYQTRNGNPPDREQTTVQDFFTKIDNISLDETIQRVDDWYQKNPDRLDMAVLAVIWVDMVEPNITQ